MQMKAIWGIISFAAMNNICRLTKMAHYNKTENLTLAGPEWPDVEAKNKTT